MNKQNWKIFVISLRRARERRLNVLRNLKDIGLPFEIVDAFDARQVRPELLVRGPGGGHLSDTEVAYSSHLGIFERVVDYGLGYGLILEDDFRIEGSGPLTLANVWDHLPAGADHVQLHDFKLHFSSEYYVEEEGELFNRLGCTNVLGVGYIFSSRLAKFVLKCHRVPEVPFDCMLRDVSARGIFDFYDVTERFIMPDFSFPSEIR